MALAINRENYVLHKLHSLTGIVPVGYYMAQHLALNSFSLAGPEKFNGVIGFFESIPKFALLALEVVAIWLPLLFHSVYGLFITFRAKPNYIGTRYGWSQNRMFTLQRWSGIVIFIFLAVHVTSTTGQKYLTNNAESIEYAAMQQLFTSYAYLPLAFYAIGVLASSYHLAYGIWNFCIRWGITISESAQVNVQKISAGVFIALTLLGWASLGGFLIHPVTEKAGETVKASAPSGPIPVSNQG
jgi:succinate dehydrogenase / fumarate reductase cytochrome b subunit